MPLALTGPLGSVGQQMRHGAEFWAKWQNAKGGLLGRPIELSSPIPPATPPTCVRKAQEVVERDGCRLLFGMTLSSEALAVVPKLAEWNAIFISSDNGDGRLTGSSLRAELLPRQHLRTDGDARRFAVAARMRSSRTSMRIGMDYAWGHNSIGVFEDEVKKAKKNFVGAVLFADRHQGFLDLHHQDPPVRRRCLLHGAAGRRQQRVPVAGAASTGCRDKVQLLTEIVDLTIIHAVGDAALGLVGSTRYTFTIDNPANKEFVAAVAEGIWQRARHVRRRAVAGLPDAGAGIEKAGSIEADKLRPALETVAIDSIKGHVAMRACDHQAVQQGYMVKVVKQEDYTTPVPEVIATYPGDASRRPATR